MKEVGEEEEEGAFFVEWDRRARGGERDIVNEDDVGFCAG